jgi:hypothetical protein
MTDGLIIGIGVLLAVSLTVTLLVYLRVLRSTLRIQCLAIERSHPGAVIVSCTAALVTNVALRRIGRPEGKSYGSTGRVFSLAASDGKVLLFRGRTVEVFADFDSEALRDVRVGTTTWGLADFTTLFLGINVGGNTFELPVRVNGPRQTSLLTASRGWAHEQAIRILREVKG